MTELEAIELELIDRELANRQPQPSTQQPKEQIGLKDFMQPLKTFAMPYTQPNTVSPFRVPGMNILGAANELANLTAKAGRIATQPVIEQIPQQPNISRTQAMQSFYKNPSLGSLGSALGQQVSPRQAISTVRDIAIDPRTYVGIAANLLPKIEPHIPTIMDKTYRLSRVQKMADSLDDLRNTFGTLKQQAVEQVATKPVVMNWINKSDKVLKAMQNPVCGIEFTAENQPVMTVGNMDKVKEAVGDLIGSQTLWEEAPKAEQRFIKQFYGQISEAMKKAAPEIVEPMSLYHEFMKRFNIANKTLRTSTGKIVESKFQNTFVPKVETTEKSAWADLIRLDPRMEQIVKDIHKYIGRQGLKKMAEVVGGGGAGIYLAHRYLSEKMFGRR